MDQSLLAPVLAMALLSFIVTIWMYALRIPAMAKAKMDPREARHTNVLDALPNPARQVGDNYNHLFEQPTVFYAVALAIAVGGLTDSFHLYCAWGYVLIRAVHTLIQCTYNNVMHRFPMFALSWVILAIMTLRGLLALI